jgi:hypothetical protein
MGISQSTVQLGTGSRGEGEGRGGGENRGEGRGGNLHFYIAETKAESLDFLREAEGKDHYLSTCNQTRQNAIIRQAYHPAIISKSIIANTYEYLNEIYAKIPVKLRTELGRVVIVYMMPTADEGMPHTREPNIICLPYRLYDPSLQVIVHELWHIHQRQYKGVWTDFYKQMWWNCRPVSGEEWKRIMATDLGRNLRVNPDTVDRPLWVWNNEWVPMSVFRSPTQGRLQDCMLRIYNIRTGNYYSVIPEWFKERFDDFALNHGLENPGELSAYILQEGRGEGRGKKGNEVLYNAFLN